MIVLRKFCKKSTVAALCAAMMMLLTACSLPESAVYADKGAQAGILAVVGDVEITEHEVAELMAAQLLKVDRERKQILKQGLDRLVAERLVELEASQQGLSADAMLEQEVDSQVVEPTAEEVDAFYEQQKTRIRQPKEQVSAQITEYLLQQRRTEARAEFVAGLKAKHDVQLYLEPFRVAVDASGFPTKGSADAPVTIVEFSDFECPYCARITPTLDRVLASYGDKVRLVFRQFPLNNIHPNAQKAAEASLCAHDQESFWEMHDAMFKEQRSLGVEQLKEKAARLGLDADAFNECLDSSRYADAIIADLEAGSRLGVTGTPAMFINGRFLSGAQPYEDIAKVIDDELESANTGS